MKLARLDARQLGKAAKVMQWRSLGSNLSYLCHIVREMTLCNTNRQEAFDVASSCLQILDRLG
jgi:hypothetical protein